MVDTSKLSLSSIPGPIPRSITVLPKLNSMSSRDDNVIHQCTQWPHWHETRCCPAHCENCCNPIHFVAVLPRDRRTQCLIFEASLLGWLVDRMDEGCCRTGKRPRGALGYEMHIGSRGEGGRDWNKQDMRGTNKTCRHHNTDRHAKFARK